MKNSVKHLDIYFVSHFKNLCSQTAIEYKLEMPDNYVKHLNDVNHWVNTEIIITMNCDEKINAMNMQRINHFNEYLFSKY